jgi:hypothetical protein
MASLTRPAPAGLKVVLVVIATDSHHAMTTLGIIAALTGAAAFAVAIIALWGAGGHKRHRRIVK